MRTAALKKERLVFGAYLIILIVAIEVTFHHFEWPAWPAFLVMIFFFETHMDKKLAPHLIIGGLVGISCYMLTVEFVEWLSPTLGVETARLIFICGVVYAIVAFGEILPIVFNNFSFMFYLVSGLASRIGGQEPAPFMWMAIVVVGGTVVISSILLITKWGARVAEPAEGKPPSSTPDKP